MKTSATGASAKQSGFSAHAAQRNSAAATSTATQACASVTKRPAVNASTTSPRVCQVTGYAYDAATTPRSANGSAKMVWGSLTKFAYRTRRLSPANVCPSRASELNAEVLPHGIDLLSRFLVHHDPVR